MPPQATSASTPERAGDRPDLDAVPPVERRRSVAELAYERLRDALVSLAIAPGTVLARGALAARLGVSQTPVREAILRLQAEGLVEVVPHSATRASLIDLAQAWEAQFLRLSIEVEIVRRLARAPSAALAAELRAGLARMRALLAAGDQAGFAVEDEAFHGALYAAACVPGLRELVRVRSGHLDRLRRLHLPAPGKAESVMRDHEALAGAILAGDAAGAEALLRAHLSGTFAEAERLRAASPQMFAPAAGPR
ncbi:GntR family transcriptional regulator [Falsiroseomonas sp. CW058]|uniref:GntR family transcriptional regulator n=1 Tax=Falsiroseomonas sp. CW058 TaxID=3388664 RepID=UPI003D322DB2